MTPTLLSKGLLREKITKNSPKKRAKKHRKELLDKVPKINMANWLVRAIFERFLISQGQEGLKIH
jgi:hypothetical protein